MFTYAFYRFPSASDFLAAWATAGMPLEDGQPLLPGGAVDVAGEPPPPADPDPEADPDAPPPPAPGWYVNAAWPAQEPANLVPFHIPPNQALRVFAGWESATPPPPAPEPPKTIRLLQFLGQAVVAGIITPEEALAAAKTGEVPEAIDQIFVASLTPEQVFGARLAWAGMYEVDRDSPLLVLVAASRGMTEADMDQFFLDASAR